MNSFELLIRAAGIKHCAAATGYNPECDRACATRCLGAAARISRYEGVPWYELEENKKDKKKYKEEAREASFTPPETRQDK